MKKARAPKKWLIAGAVVLILAVAGVVGAGGCGGQEYESGPPTTAAYFGEAKSEADGGFAMEEGAAYAPEAAQSLDARGSIAGDLAALQASADQKIMANAELTVEVEKGQFQTAFARATLLADRYGGYVLSSNSYASGEEDSIKSGTIAVRVPARSFANALSDAAQLGELKGQRVWTEDVTAEYVDLQSRIANQQVYVNQIQALLAKAKTIDEILQVNQTLSYAQEQLEQLKGRMRYLDEHTAFSTLALTIYEAGVEVAPPSEWGFLEALKDGLHNLVEAFSAVVRGLGWIVPVVIIVAIVVYVIYLIARAATRKSRQRGQGQSPGGPAAPGGHQGTPATGQGVEAAVIGDQKGKEGKTS